MKLGILMPSSSLFKYTAIKKTDELSSDFPLLLSIPVVGELTATTIIGEIGCVSRFPTVKQLVAYSGFRF